jgi:hypothetical protein
MAEPKTRPTNASVKGFIDKLPDEQVRVDCFAIAEMMQQATGYEPKMWGPSIVGFGVINYKNSSGKGVDWPMIGFSPRKQNLTLYITSGGFEQYDGLMKKLGKHSTSKACLYIKRLSDVHIPTLKKLIAQSVKYTKKKYA